MARCSSVGEIDILAGAKSPPSVQFSKKSGLPNPSTEKETTFLLFFCKHIEHGVILIGEEL